jgi:abortive infection bacteriophage resistance protein
MPNLFKENVTFKHIYRLYEFDKKLRQLLIGVLESMEIAFRTHIAYDLAHIGSLGYEKSENLSNTLN